MQVPEPFIDSISRQQSKEKRFEGHLYKNSDVLKTVKQQTRENKWKDNEMAGNNSCK